jgi:hypothetical protein
MPTFNDEPDAIGVDRLIVPERREQITRQRRDFMREMAADEKATGWVATLQTGTELPATAYSSAATGRRCSTASAPALLH